MYEPQFTDANLQMEALEVCGDDSFCLFDVAVTERMEVGLSTLAASQELAEIVQVSLPGIEQFDRLKFAVFCTMY